jgi:hypothetical protein
MGTASQITSCAPSIRLDKHAVAELERRGIAQRLYAMTGTMDVWMQYHTHKHTHTDTGGHASRNR